MKLEGENFHISISDKNFSETILEEFDYMYTDEGCLIDLFEVTLNIIDDAKFDLFKELIGGDIPESLQTDEYMDFIYKVFKVERVKGEIMEEKKLSEFLKEKGAYESFIENCLSTKDTFIENCLNTKNTLQSIIDHSLSNIGIKNGFIWGFTPQGFVYWSKLHSEISKLNITNDMDEILYKEYERRNMKESSEQNPTTKDIVENDVETKVENIKQEFQTITLNGVDYYLIPKEISVGYIANWQDKDIKVESYENYGEKIQSRTDKVGKCMNCGGTGQEYIPYTSKRNAYFKTCTKCQGVGKLN